MAASMIHSVANFHRIHPYKVLYLIIPYHIELLLANGTWLIGKSRVRWYGDMLVFGVSSGKRCSKCSLRCIGGSICERSILRVVARFDPFLDHSVGESAAFHSGMTYQLIDVPAAVLATLGRVG